MKKCYTTFLVDGNKYLTIKVWSDKNKIRKQPLNTEKVWKGPVKDNISSEAGPLLVSLKISTPTGISQGPYERLNRKSEMVNSC